MPKLKEGATSKEREAYNQYFRLYRLKNLKQLQEYKRSYNAKWRKEHGYPSEKKYKKLYPEKMKAHQAVFRAIQSGKLEKKPCQFCGSVKSQAHHDNYTKPLEVRWLCPLHHTAWHRTHRAKGVEKSKAITETLVK